MGWVIQGEYELINIYQPVSGGGGGLTIGTTTITSGTSTRLLFDAAGVVSETDGATWDATNKALTVGGATVTTSNPVLNLTQTWNAGAVAFTGIKLNVTNTASAAASLLMDLQVGSTSVFTVNKSGCLELGRWAATTFNGAVIGKGDWNLDVAIGYDFYFENQVGFYVDTGNFLGWSTSSPGGSSRSVDTRITRVGAGIIGVRAGSNTNGAALSMVEQTAPSAPSANGVYLYAQDNGAGKTQLMALFASGAAQQVAIEP